MKLSLTRVAAIAILGLCAPAMAAEELVENPAYKNWASYKPGTSVTFKGVTETKIKVDEDQPAQAMKMEMSITQKLVEVTAEKVVLEQSMTMTMQGRNMSPPAQKHEIAAKIEKSKADLAMAPQKGEVKVSNVKDGKDTLEVKGEKLAVKTKEMDSEITDAGRTTKSHVKMWFAEKIPSGMVKMVTSSKEPMESEMTMTLVDYTIGK